jgi:hypothetical protein
MGKEETISRTDPFPDFAGAVERVDGMQGGLAA